MTWKDHGLELPFKAASAIGAFMPVFQPIASSRDDTVVLAASHNNDVLGLTIATVATYGDPVAVVVTGVAKGVAGASLGAGARVAVGSTNGVLAPLLASGAASGGAAVNARYIVGRAMQAAAAGDIFPVLLGGEQII